MNVQDEERRRIARELHETTAQDLAALKMNLAALERSGSFQNEKDRALLSESTQLAEQAMKDVRTLSYLLHPPFLDEVGLVPALRWYAMGFAQRSGIGVDLSLPEDFERLPQELETTLFRIVQESLTNIHRHAASPRAAIRLRRTGPALELEVQDWGRGIPPASDNHKPLPHVFGVGIAGMRERIEQLGGELEVEFGNGGTTVKAWVSLPESQ
jgi:signal transduction histidine kinase